MNPFERPILIASGTGGVGKTTVSTALALAAGMQGKRALVITMDPAKRLAHAMGLDQLPASNKNQPVDLTLIARKTALEMNLPFTGEFWAMMPDTHHTLEELVEDLAPKPETAERVKNNPIFKLLSQDYSGANEYMAIQRIYTLERDPRFDTLILDTPPNRNILAMLRAPGLLTQFFEDRIVHFLMGPTQKVFSSTLFNAGLKGVLKALEKVTGQGFVSQLIDFGSALLETRTAFTQRMTQALELFQSDRVGFLLVATPQPEKIQELEYLSTHLAEKKCNFDGVVLNRTLSYLGPSKKMEPIAYAILRCEQKKEMELEARINKSFSVSQCKLPELARDVHNIQDLFHIAKEIRFNSFSRPDPTK